MLYTIVNFTTQCGENRHTVIANFATLIHTKKLIHCVAIFTILYGNYYPAHGEFKLICIGKFARRTWVNFTQQYGKNRQSCQQNIFHYAVWQLLLYFYREFPSKILSVYENVVMKVFFCFWNKLWCLIKNAYFVLHNSLVPEVCKFWNCSEMSKDRTKDFKERVYPALRDQGLNDIPGDAEGISLVW